VNWSPDKGVSLARNPFYHGAYGGNVSRVEVSLLKPEVGWQEGMDQYVSGQIDFLDVSWFPSEIIRAAQRKFGEFYTTLLPGPTTISIGFNRQRPPLDDIRLRRALALAIDQQQMVRDLQKDNAVPALGGYVPPGLPGHSPDIGLPYDPVAAQRLLAEAGYPDGKDFPSLEMAWFDFPNSREQAEYISQFWFEQLGVIIKPRYVPIPELIDTFIQGKPPAIFCMGWAADYHDPDSFLRMGLQSSTRGHQPLLDKIETARKMTDQGRRLALYQEVDKIVVEEAISIPLFYLSYPVFISSRVRKLPSTMHWRDFILDPD
jgi:oligopeptide transport system substrate-binding protein